MRNQLKCGCSYAKLKMAKRPPEEYEDVSEIVNPSPSAKIRCVVSSLSLCSALF